MAKNHNKLAAQQRRRQEVENELDRELEQTFPASDALQITRDRPPTLKERRQRATPKRAK